VLGVLGEMGHYKHGFGALYRCPHWLGCSTGHQILIGGFYLKGAAMKAFRYRVELWIGLL